jgi:peptidoglycan/xylan/chitin deacetylase (PgdA/CDA1 family)
MTGDELRELASRPGLEVGFHSTNHLDLTAIPEDVRRREIITGKAGLEDILGRPVDLFAYPFGVHDESVRSLVREAGFTAAVAVGGGAVTPRCDRFALPRLEVAGWTPGELDRRLSDLLGSAPLETPSGAV